MKLDKAIEVLEDEIRGASMIIPTDKLPLKSALQLSIEVLKWRKNLILLTHANYAPLHGETEE